MTRRGKLSLTLSAAILLGFGGAANALAQLSLSISPSSGTGPSQIFTAVFSDPNGAADLNVAVVAFAGSAGLANNCVVAYFPSNSTFYLLNDAGTGWVTPTLSYRGSRPFLGNSKCLLYTDTSQAASSGTNLTLSLDLFFATQTGVGRKIIFLYSAANSGSSSGWQSEGIWTVVSTVNYSPQALSVTPSSGSGSSQIFSLLFNDDNGAADLNFAAMVINGTPSLVNGCVALYAFFTNQLLLLNDAATSWLGPMIVGAPGTLQNSQCTVTLQTSSASISQIDFRRLNLSLALSFSASFSGNKTVFLNGIDNSAAASGWQALGTWTVP